MKNDSVGAEVLDASAIRCRRKRRGWAAGFFTVLVLAQIALFQPRPEISRFFGEALAGYGAGEADEEALTTLWRPREIRHVPLPTGTAVVRDDGGSIQTIVLHFGLRWADEVSPLYDDLLAKLPVEVEIQALCSDEAARNVFLASWGNAERARGREVKALVSPLTRTVWARDRQVGLQTPDGTFQASLMPTVESNAEEDIVHESRVASVRLEEGLIDRVGGAPYFFEGGNVVSNGRHIFVGANLLAENRQVVSDEKRLLGRLSSLFGRSILVLRDRKGDAPWTHADLYLTPIDGRRVLLASLSDGARIAGAGALGGAPGPGEADARKQRQLDEIASLLRKNGYEVLRLPALRNPAEGSVLSYNNVIMDRRGDRRVVYMPVYRVPALDEAAAARYRELGFEVRTVDVSKLFHRGGALRCAANVTRRGPSN